MNKLTTFFKLVRWPNLVIMALILAIIRYGFLLPLGFDVTLSTFWHAVFILATLLIAAGGNAVNDAHDVNADRINKPEKLIVSKRISIENALFTGQALLLSGSVLGLVLGYFTNQLTFSYIFPLTSLLLWVYASHLKKMAFIGNLAIAFLGGLLIFNSIIFDLLYTLKFENRDNQLQAVYVLITLSGFSFVITLVREIIKDLQDADGDKRAGYKTLPVTSGKSLSKILGIGFTMILIAAVGWLVFQTFSAKDWLSTAYLVFMLIAPLVFIMIKIAPAKTAADFATISTLLKIVMVFGAFSLFVFTLIFRLG